MAGMANQTNENEEEMKELKHIGFDIIEGLHCRNMYLVLQQILEYLNGEDLLNAELTSKAWKAAISSVNLSMFWKIQFQLKLANSLLWNNLHFNLAPSYDLALKDHWYSRKLFNKLQFTVEKTVTKNLIENDLTKDFIHYVIEESRKIHVNGIDFTKKYILLPFFGFHIQICNRHTLKVEEEIHLPEEQNLYVTFVLYEDAFMCAYNQQITIRHLITKKTEVFKPPIEDDDDIARLFAANGFLVAGIGLKDDEIRDCHTAMIWEIKSPCEIAWENFVMVPSSVRFCDVFMDQRFLIFTHLPSPPTELQYFIRSTSEPRKKGKVFKFPSRFKICMNNIVHSDNFVVKYCDGFLFEARPKHTTTMILSKYDVQSGITDNVSLKVDLDPESTDFGMSIDCGFLLIDHHCAENLRWTTKLWIWDFKTIMDPSSSLRTIPPAFDISLRPSPFIHFDRFGDNLSMSRSHVDMFGSVYVSELEESENMGKGSHTIRTVSFLPVCNRCKEIRKNLRRCSRCKLVKYCDSKCQIADWIHHKEMCKKKMPISSDCAGYCFSSPLSY